MKEKVLVDRNIQGYAICGAILNLTNYIGIREVGIGSAQLTLAMHYQWMVDIVVMLLNK